MTVDHNLSITKDEANQLFRELDTNNNGSIDFDEFLAKLTVNIFTKLKNV